MSRWTVLEETDRRAASEEVLGRRPSLISWWIVWRRRQSGRSLNAPARPTKKRYQLSAVSCQFSEPPRQATLGFAARDRRHPSISPREDHSPKAARRTGCDG